MVVLVKCLICPRIEEKMTTLAMKKNNLNKYARWECASHAMLWEGVMRGESYRDNYNKHFRNEKDYGALGCETILHST